jgi:hypothetical protein
MFENYKDMWAISSQASNRRRFNDYLVAQSTLITRWKSEIPKNNIFYIIHGKDIVYSFMKIKVVKRIDTGLIMLEVTQEEREKLAPLINAKKLPPLTIKICIYKNRRGRWKNVILWCEDRRDICRIIPRLVTTYSFEVVPMEDIKIKIQHKGAF